jgi:transposase-like protein
MRSSSKKRGLDVLGQLLKERGVKDMRGIQDLVKELTSDLIQQVLDAELEEALGYSKYDYKNKATSNSRNGYSKKRVKSSQGDIELNIPRDRESEFEPQLVRKHQTDISSIEDKILFLYSQGTSTRDMRRTMSEMYGIEVDESRVSRITDKLLPLISEWQNRPLKDVYAMVVLDAIHYKVREEGGVVSKAAYIAIGTDLEGMKEVFGIWLGAIESSKFWLGVLNGLKNRGVKDILIATSDGLTGFSEAINTAFPETDVQRCIVHQIRNSMKYVSWKDLKEFTADLKGVYKAVTEEAALMALGEFEVKWGNKYPMVLRSWHTHWTELSAMFKYSPEIRRIIYTTNAIENFNRQLRKVTKNKGAFVSDDALMKILYLATMGISDKWVMPIKNWGNILNNLIIHFGDRVKVRI